MTKKPRRSRSDPQQNTERLLRVLTNTLARTTDEALRQRLEAAIKTLREKMERPAA
jgi:hypothetical protein